MPSARIYGKEYPVAEIFSSYFAFQIASYQRPYAWTTEQAGELLDDLVGAVGDSDRGIGEPDPYFLGSIVLIKEDGDPDSEVVDGQQRLATLAILLAALRATLSGKESEDLTDFLYERGSVIRGMPNRYRLRLRPRDEVFFRDYVQEQGSLTRLDDLDPTLLSDSQKNIRENALKYFQRLRDMTEEQRISLAKFVATSCYLVVVSTPNLDSAYRVFSVLNDRGLDLSHADILKAEVIGKIPSSLQETYTDRWEEAEVRLGREAFKELFSHIRAIYRKAKLRGTVLKEFRDHVLVKESPENLIDKVLLPYADAYEDVKNCSYEGGDKAGSVNEWLTWLNKIDNVDWIPPAMLFLSRNVSHPDRLEPFFRDLERLAAGLMVRRATINERIERYARLLKVIEDGNDLYSTDSPLQLTAAECKAIVKTLDNDLYPMAPIRLYVLLRLDSALSGGGATYQYPLITVEHVLPQNPAPGAGWGQLFPWPKDDEWVHRLANLVLLTRKKNSAARNYSFEKKKHVYFTTGGVSPFVLTTQVLNEQEWAPAVLVKRQGTLVAELKKLWRLESVE